MCQQNLPTKSCPRSAMPTLTVAYVLPLTRLPNASKVATLVIQVRGGHWKNITNRFVYPGMYPWEPQRQTWIRHQFGYINIRWISGNGIFFWRPRMGGLDSRSDQVAISPSGMSLRQDSRFVLKIPCKTRCICISLWTHDCIYFWAYTMDASLNHNSNCLLAY